MFVLETDVYYIADMPFTVLHGVLYESDGKILATAAGQLKIFNSSDHKKMHKFSGHPVSLIQLYT